MSRPVIYAAVCTAVLFSSLCGYLRGSLHSCIAQFFVRQFARLFAWLPCTAALHSYLRGCLARLHCTVVCAAVCALRNKMYSLLFIKIGVIDHCACRHWAIFLYFMGSIPVFFLNSCCNLHHFNKHFFKVFGSLRIMRGAVRSEKIFASEAP